MLLEVLRATLVLFLVAYAPGWAWLAVLMPWLRTPIERIAARVALSLALMVLLLFMSNAAFGIAISGGHAIWIALGVTALGIGTRLQPRVHAAIAPRSDEVL